MAADRIEVIAPNLKRRLSGVTATIARLIPVQAGKIGIVATGPGLPATVPHISLIRAATLPNTHRRVWHARRNTEMLLGLIYRHILRRDLALVFTSASQRVHTGYTRWLISHMDAVISTSRRTAEYMDRQSHVILHGIDTDRFSPPADRAALRQRLGLPDGILIGCFGRIRHQKGTDVFVDAIMRLAQDNPDVVGIVMGRATDKHKGYLQDLKSKVQSAGMAANVLFPPEVTVDQVPEWYQTLDLFVAPQRWEGFGLTPIEAMSCGVPTVATRVGAFEELVMDGETGALIPPGDVGAMADALAGYVDDPDHRASASAAARALMLKDFRLEREADQIIAVYRELLSSA